MGFSAGSAASVVSSNLGVVNPAAYRPDGTGADQFVMRTLGPGVTKAIMHRLGGLLVVLSGRTQPRAGEAITWRMRLQVSRMRPNCVT